MPDNPQVAALALLLCDDYFQDGYNVAQLVDAFLAARADPEAKAVRWLCVGWEELTGGCPVGDFRISESSTVNVRWDLVGLGKSMGDNDLVRVQILDNGTATGWPQQATEVIVEYITPDFYVGSSGSSGS